MAHQAPLKYIFYIAACAYRKSHSAFSPTVTLLHCAQNLPQHQFAGDRVRAGDGWKIRLAVATWQFLRGGEQTSLPKSRRCRHVITHLFSLGYARSGSYSCHRDDNF